MYLHISLILSLSWPSSTILSWLFVLSTLDRQYESGQSRTRDLHKRIYWQYSTFFNRFVGFIYRQFCSGIFYLWHRGIPIQESSLMSNNIPYTLFGFYILHEIQLILAVIRSSSWDSSHSAEPFPSNINILTKWNLFYEKLGRPSFGIFILNYTSGKGTLPRGLSPDGQFLKSFHHESFFVCLTTRLYIVSYEVCTALAWRFRLNAYMSLTWIRHM